MRLRTLPLSLSGTVAGIALAAKVAPVNWATALLLGLTTALLQILSNLSNELGDTLHGTDTAERQGVHYSIMDGEMTIPEMKRLIAAVAGLCCISGLAMVLLSFGTLLSLQPVLLLVLGAGAIWAAMNYTLGAHPYGYRGLGDVFVFVFFGLVSVLGAAYVCSHMLRWDWLLVGSGIGCFSMGVLNVNNIRDMKTDGATRTTVALKLGLRRARIYQIVLIGTGWAMMLSFSGLTWESPAAFLYVATMPLYFLHLRGVWRRSERRLDPMLPMLVMSTFALSILFAIGY